MLFSENLDVQELGQRKAYKELKIRRLGKGIVNVAMNEHLFRALQTKIKYYRSNTVFASKEIQVVMGYTMLR